MKRKTRIKVKSGAIQTKSIKSPSYIAGLGGSAGGLEAFEQFFAQMPDNSGIGFVVATHLDPNHKGNLPQLLQRVTSLKVKEAEDGELVMPNQIYVIPPNKDLAIHDGALKTVDPVSPRGLRMPIDFFLRSLAEDQKERAIAIILSGMGSDGTLGLRTIKEKVGIVMAQEPTTAKFDAMPTSAIDTGLVDVVAPAGDLPRKLLDFSRNLSAIPKIVEVTEDASATVLQKIFSLLRDHTGHDFSFYKKNTLYRRIERRMSVNQIKNISRYVRHLQENPAEVSALFKELLIGVTNFFRDPAAFAALERALPRLLKENAPENTIRAWAAGCSTGEEAYSLAMLLREAADKIKSHHSFKIQVFGTDIDKDAIEKARMGVYPTNISVDVRPDRLHRFFIIEENRYRIKKDLRALTVFAQQNVIMDPPFTKLDILCCRNLLIYVNADLQKKLIPLFHHALKPGGILFLGPSETIGTYGDLFDTIDSKWKIFARKEVASPPRMLDLPSTFPAKTDAKSLPPANKRAPSDLNVPEATQRLLNNIYAPPSVVINEQGDIIFIHGRTGKYLEPSAGKASMNVFFMAREGLKLGLTTAIRQASKTRNEVSQKNLRVKTNGIHELVTISVKPCGENEELRGLFLVSFKEVSKQNNNRLMAAPPSARSVSARELEKELKSTRETLESTIEEMETSQEELKSTNEELQSANEELQSSNEELTTSKEEMQSLNEELVTVNTELESKVDALSRTNNDMKNLLNSIDLATVFLDNDLNVKRFTPQATRLINLIPADVGRPISHIASNLKYDNLLKDVQEVMRTLVFREIQVQNEDGRWFLTRIMPYRTIENVIDGTAITFSDISSMKSLEDSLMKSEAAAVRERISIQHLLELVREPILILDGKFRVVSASNSFYKIFELNPESTEKQLIFDLQEKRWDLPVLHELLTETLSNTKIMSRELPPEFVQPRQKIVVHANKVQDSTNVTERILLTFERLS